MPKNAKYKIVSVGGSIIIPPTGFDINFLTKFRSLIVSAVKKGQKFILVIGGGGTARQYQGALRNFTQEPIDLDWVGIKSTVLNAEFVKFLFKNYAHPVVVLDPTKRIKTSKPIIIAAGWKPGCSTDKDAVLLAKTYGAAEVVNLSNVDYVYTSDPKLNPHATKLEYASWVEFRKIVGSTWSPGANVPFDPIAAKVAQSLKLTVRFARGTDLPAVAKVLAGVPGVGSIIN